MGVGADDETKNGRGEGPKVHGADEPLGHVAGVDEPSAALAWRILSSPRTFVALAALAAAILCLAAILPQRPLPGELARTLPFAAAEAVRNLGLDDVLVSWPILLVGLLMALNGAGILLAATLRRASTDVADGAPNRLLGVSATRRVEADLATLRPRLTSELGLRLVGNVASRGFVREGLAVAGLGVLALIGALVVSRGPAIDARIKANPGAPGFFESTVRDGDLVLLRQLPFWLHIDRPDPQDPRRAFNFFENPLGGEVVENPTAIEVAPGGQASVAGFTVTPILETLRAPRDTDALELVIRRGAARERLNVTAGQTVELKSGGERLTAFHGPDGPIMVLAREVDGAAQTTLLVPSPDAPTGDFAIEVEHQTTVTLAATTSPEAPLALAGLALLLVGLLLASVVPHLRLELVPEPGGTLVGASSLNRARLVEGALAVLDGRPAEPPSSFVAALGPAFRASMPTQLAALVALGVGLFVGVSASFGTVALPFALATLVALGTRAALPLGALTLVAGLGTVPDVSLPSIELLVAMVCAGLALGAVGRWLALDDVLRDKPLLACGVFALAVAVILSVPPVSLQLATSDGQPLSYGATLVDGPSLMQVAWPVPAFMAGTRSLLSQIVMVLAWLGALALLSGHVSGSRRPNTTGLWTTRNAELAGLVVGGLALVAGLVGIASLFGTGAIESEAARRHLDLLASRDASVVAIAPGSFELRLWSRPFVDGLLVLLGGFLVWRLWPSATRKPTASAMPSRIPASGAHAFVALATTALAAFLVARDSGLIDGASLIALAAALLIVGALLLTRTSTTTPDRGVAAVELTRIALAGAALLLVAMWLLPPLFSA